MVGGHREHELHLAENGGGEIAGRLAEVIGPHHEVHPSALKGVPGAGKDFLDHLNVNRYPKSMKIPDGREQALCRQQRIETDFQPGFPALGHLLGGVGQVLGCLKQRAPFLEQVTAGRRQDGPVPAAIIDVDVQILFQFLDRVTDRGRYPEEFRGGPGEAALAVNGVKDFQGIDGDGCMHVRNI